MKMRYRSGIKQQDLKDIVKKNLNNFMKSFLSSRLAHMTVAWFQKIALPVHCPSAISERKLQFKYQLGIGQDIFKLSQKKLPGIFRLLELIDSLMGLVTQPQIVLARLCTVSTTTSTTSTMPLVLSLNVYITSNAKQSTSQTNSPPTSSMNN